MADTRSGMPSSAPLLAGMLQIAVPMKIADLRGTPPGWRRQMGREMADEIAAHSDDMVYGGKHCAPTFAATARGLAALAFQPGGVGFLGTLWCARHAPLGRAVPSGEHPLCEDCVREEEAARSRPLPSGRALKRRAKRRRR